MINKIRDIFPDDIRITDLENIFGLYKDAKGNYSYNLNETLYLNVQEDKLKEYVCTCECFWPLVSYKIYETTRLAWLLMKVNNIEAKDMFRKLNPGDKVKYLDIDTMNNIVNYING